jgi:GNAT superfamily N-acetyltransferase
MLSFCNQRRLLMPIAKPSTLLGTLRRIHPNQPKSRKMNSATKKPLSAVASRSPNAFAPLKEFEPDLTQSQDRKIVHLETRRSKSTDKFHYFPLRKKIRESRDARFFSDSFEREDKLTTPEMQDDWCRENRHHCIFLTYAPTEHGEELIGTLMLTQQGSRDSPVVESEALWVDHRFRDAGVAKNLLETGREWALEHGYKFFVVFIRDDNKDWLKVREKQGFVHAYTIDNERYADGTIGNTLALILDIRPSTPDQRREQTLLYLEEAVSFLTQILHAPPSFNTAKLPSTGPTHLGHRSGRAHLG